MTKKNIQALTFNEIKAKIYFVRGQQVPTAVSKFFKCTTILFTASAKTNLHPYLCGAKM
jgi:hypothetical protein